MTTGSLRISGVFDQKKKTTSVKPRGKASQRIMGSYFSCSPHDDLNTFLMEKRKEVFQINWQRSQG